jgi:hypothetical protein
MTPPFVPGQPVVCVIAAGAPGLVEGYIYPVSECIRKYPWNIVDRCPGVKGNGWLVRLDTRSTMFKATRFPPLHGTDILKLEEKYPEYVVKTRVVEG